MHTAQDKFICHVFMCEPSSGALCKTIEAACKVSSKEALFLLNKAVRIKYSSKEKTKEIFFSKEMGTLLHFKLWKTKQKKARTTLFKQKFTVTNKIFANFALNISSCAIRSAWMRIQKVGYQAIQPHQTKVSERQLKISWIHYHWIRKIALIPENEPNLCRYLHRITSLLKLTKKKQNKN